MRDLLNWECREVRDERALRAAPWYAFAMLVAGQAGVRISDLVRVHSLVRAPSRAATVAFPPRLWMPLPGGLDPMEERTEDDDDDVGGGGREKEGEGEREEEEEEESPGGRGGVSPPGTPVRRPEASEKRRERGGGRVPRALEFGGPPGSAAAMSTAMLSGASTHELRGRVRRLLVQDEADALQQRIGARKRARLLANVDHVNTTAATGRAFLSPAFVGAKDLAVELVRDAYPGSLGDVRVRELEESRDVRTLFAALAASALNIGRFSGGRAPLRAGDYERYAERKRWALQRFRYVERVARSGPYARRLRMNNAARAAQRSAQLARRDAFRVGGGSAALFGGPAVDGITGASGVGGGVSPGTRLMQEMALGSGGYGRVPSQVFI
jgi:hypothetical protein